MQSLYQRVIYCFCGLLIFGMGYSLLNAYTNALNQISQIPSILFDFDYYIPFIPMMIVFYSLSIVWFIGSFFVIPIKELPRLAYKIILASLISCLVFYYFPLHFDFQRNNFNYLNINWQAVYYILYIFDKPFNQSPSLHIVFVILIAHSLRHKIKQYHSILQIIFYVFSFLIAISTLLTWQHHFIDIITGIICAMSVIFIENKLYINYHQKIIQSIIKYLVISILGFLMIVTIPVIFNFPMIFQAIMKYISYYWLFSFLLLCVIYIIQNKIHHKTLKLLFNKNHQGRFYFYSIILFMPLIIIYQLMLLIALRFDFWQYQKLPILLNYNDKKIAILATGKPSKKVFKKMIKNYDKIIYIDTCVEIQNCIVDSNVVYFYCPMLDLMVFDSTQYQRILDYMIMIRKEIEQSLNNRILIICQCAMGRSRSVAMMGCLLAYFNHLTFDELILILDKHCQNHLAKPYLGQSVIDNLAIQGL